ncbi:hypothetical protein AB4865_11450 [Capnocytophaga sp. ARDL2]|uniref:hypothetical protein n=1 Tax=Capnocytophaga sp. ARDL2 TaxID=3238809 RepID=UPI0035568CE0
MHVNLPQWFKSLFFFQSFMSTGENNIKKISDNNDEFTFTHVYNELGYATLTQFDAVLIEYEYIKK